MFRFLFFIFCFYLVYRILTSSRRRAKKFKQNSKSPFYRSGNGYSSPGMILDEMKKCPTCGTFNPKSHAVEYRREYYCGERCKSSR